MDDFPALTRHFLLWAPLLSMVLLSRWIGWVGLGIALVLCTALLHSVTIWQGESGWGDSANPIVHTAYVGAFWGWIMGFCCAAGLFVGWCRRNLKVANQ